MHLKLFDRLISLCDFFVVVTITALPSFDIKTKTGNVI